MNSVWSSKWMRFAGVCLLCIVLAGAVALVIERIQ